MINMGLKQVRSKKIQQAELQNMINTGKKWEATNNASIIILQKYLQKRKIKL